MGTYNDYGCWISDTYSGDGAFTLSATLCQSQTQKALIKAIQSKSNGYSGGFLARFSEKELEKFNQRLNLEN